MPDGSTAKSNKQTWDVVASVSTALMTVATFVLAVFTYRSLELTRELVAEPRVRIVDMVILSQFAAVSEVTGNDSYCGPQGFNLTNFSPQRVVQFRIGNVTSLVAPKVSIHLRAIRAPNTALTGILVERMLAESATEPIVCAELGLDLTRLGREKLPQVYDPVIASLSGQARLRVSVAFARQKESPVNHQPALYVLASALDSRSAESSDQKTFALEQ